MSSAEKETFYGLWIPKKVWDDKRLSLMEKFIVSRLLTSLAYRKTNAEMAEFFDVSTRQIQKLLRHLEELNVIEREVFTDGKNRFDERIIRITPEYWKGMEELNDEICQAL